MGVLAVGTRALVFYALLCTPIVGCGEPSYEPEWTLEFGEHELRERVVAVQTRILEGGCKGERVLYASDFAPAAMGEAPPVLEAGRYGFEARALDADCRWFARGCVEVDLPPPDGRELRVRLEAIEPTGHCTHAWCRETWCDFPPTDGGSAATLPDAASAPRAPGSASDGGEPLPPEREPATCREHGFAQGRELHSRLHDVGLPPQGTPLLLEVEGLPGFAAVAGTPSAYAVLQEGRALPVELERFDPETGKLWLWIGWPGREEGTAAGAYLCFGGDPEAIEVDANLWDDAYRGVWHLDEQGTGRQGELHDSTPTQAHGRGGGGNLQHVPLRTPTPFGAGQSFDGAEDHIRLPARISFERGTLSHWVRARDAEPRVIFYASSGRAGAQGSDAASVPLEMHTGVEDGRWSVGLRIRPEAVPEGVQARLQGEAVDIGRWTHVAATWERGGRIQLFVDGELTATAPVPKVPAEGTGSAFVVLGGAEEARTEQSWNGWVDELRLSETVRTPRWLRVQARTQRDPRAFLWVDQGVSSGG